MALFRFKDFDQAMQMVPDICEVGGKGHSCRIYSFDEARILPFIAISPAPRSSTPG